MLQNTQVRVVNTSLKKKKKKKGNEEVEQIALYTSSLLYSISSLVVCLPLPITTRAAISSLLMIPRLTDKKRERECVGRASVRTRVMIRYVLPALYCSALDLSGTDNDRDCGICILLKHSSFIRTISTISVERT